MLEMNAKLYRLYWYFSSQLRPISSKVVKFFKFLARNCRKGGLFQTLTTLLMVGSLLCFLIVVGSSYYYIFPSSQTHITSKPSNPPNSRSSNDVSSEKCDVFDGKWVVDESYPLYNASECPFAERGFDCLANGRKDNGFLKWRWKPKNCEIPRFNARAVLEILCGKRVVFVGDSLSRTQWESMICMLMTGVENKNSVFEVNKNRITKQIRHLVVRFRDFNFTVEFYRSIFLVQPGPAPRHSPKRVKTAVMLDRLDEISREWIDSDILVFNSGHWWTSTKLFEMGWYFQIGGKTKLGMPIGNAFKTALATWQSWIESAVNPNRTRVFFRTFESSHWSSGTRQTCKVTKLPSSFNIKQRQRSTISDAIIDAAKNVSVPVQLLHVTPMGAFRSDAHVGTWSDNPSVPDCSHWCLPGVPDMWNELLFSFLLSR